MDDFCVSYLKQGNFKNVTVISLEDFESPELLGVKQFRNIAEYCWTCSSSLIAFCLDNFSLDKCTYVDADIVFYDDPGMLISELSLAGKQVLITEHGFDSEHKHLETYGRFCIQFLCFSNNTQSRQILSKWQNQCIGWCYSWAEPDRFGDQKYLDNWPDEFPSVHVLEHIGALAPWNLSRFSVVVNSLDESRFNVYEKSTGISAPLIFYHFHDLKFYSNNLVSLVNGYDVSEISGKLYYPYLAELGAIEKNIIQENPSFKPELMRQPFKSDNFFRSMRARFDIILRKQKLRISGKLN